MKILGITGGVGAGKSEVLSHLEQAYGACVIQADQVGHEVMAPGGAAYEAVLQAFGQEFQKEDGTIDRKKLGTVVFADEGKRRTLNAIVHPAVKETIRRAADLKRQQGRELLVIEAALLIEDHYEEICQELWYIYAAEPVRWQRLKASRGYSDEKIDAMIRSQLSEERFRSACQAVIDNSGAFAETCRQIRELFDRSGWQKGEGQI